MYKLDDLVAFLIFFGYYRRFEQLTNKRKTQAQRAGFSYIFATSINNNTVIIKNQSLAGEPWWFPIKGAKWNRVGQ